MHRRTIKDLNLLDDFLLNAVVTYPGIGEEFCRILLGIIFRRKFGKLEIVAQKVYYGTDTDKHGARLDVYLEEEEAEGLEVPAIFDIEPEQKDASPAVRSLPRRTRFYHAKIDAKSLKAGDGYDKLKNVVVVMIMPFDPFGLNRMIYTVRNMCVEVPDMPYDDGARTLFLYTKGTDMESPEELKQLLTYMEDTCREKALNEELRRIQDMVDIVKRDEEVSLEYMKIWEREQMLLRQGEERGIEQGIERGIERGRLEEQANTERERLRAEQAEEEVRRLQEELQRLKDK